MNFGGASTFCYLFALSAWGIGFMASAARPHRTSEASLPVGAWREERTGVTLQFAHGGQLLVNGQNGRWYSAGPSKIYLQLGGGSGTATCKRVSGSLSIQGEWIDNSGHSSKVDSMYQQL
jgi:hypothetical protein